MNARRKHRVFLDHKPPLVAFVLVLVTSMVLLVHVARSDAAPAWLRQGVSSVMAGGLPLAQQVVSAAPLERTEAAPVAQPPVPAPVAPPSSATADAAPSAAAAAGPAASPQQPRAHGVRGHAHAAPSGPVPHAAPAGPGLTPPRPPQAPGGDHPGRGPRGHGVGDIPQGLTGEHGPMPGAEHPVRGAGRAEHGQHPWFDGERGHGHGRSHEQGHEQGYEHDHEHDHGHRHHERH